MFYLVSTPIGNLADLTYRAVNVLNECDLILCEDTRHSRILMKHYSITTPLKSFHKFSEAKLESTIIDQLKSGSTIALISDAGTPGISDPGTRLVDRCINEGISVTSIPGACAAITALTSSGLDTERFQFVGFLPKKAQSLKNHLIEILRYPGTSICYESPHRIKKVLTLLHEIAPKRTLSIARELTKKYEEVKRGTAEELLHIWKNREVKGEIILLISQNQEKVSWETLSIEEHILQVQEEFQLTKKEAIKLVAELRHLPKREVYQASN